MIEQSTSATIEGFTNAMRRFWQPVLRVADLPDSAPIGVTLLGEALVLVRLNGAVVAMQDLCRHFQAQLSLGEITRVAGVGDCLLCPYHGWSYAASGQCVHIPQLAPGREVPADARVPLCHGGTLRVDLGLFGGSAAL